MPSKREQADNEGQTPPQITPPTPAIELTDDGTPDLAALQAFVKEARLHRLIVVSPGEGDRVSYLESVFAQAGRPPPDALFDWDHRVDEWCDEYRSQFGECRLLEINLTTAVFVFDRTHERVVVAYGISTTPARPRDRTRMRQFPDVNIGVGVAMGEDAFAADRGHFLSHAAGGNLDINLFPQQRDLNQGRSPEGKRFRRMEMYTAAHLGTFHYHRAEYDDLTWIPATLEYGVLREDRDWWIERFQNKQRGL